MTFEALLLKTICPNQRQDLCGGYFVESGAITRKIIPITFLGIVFSATSNEIN
jgi:hypothetical protein